MAVLETSRLTLRPFREDDVDLLSELMANQDFMRSSLGVYTREQTRGFLQTLDDEIDFRTAICLTVSVVHRPLRSLDQLP